MDCTMTNIKNFKLSKIVGCVPDVKIWRALKLAKCVNVR